MDIFINGHGSISAAGGNAAAQAAVLATGRPTWSINQATGLPVYRVKSLPTHPEIDAFAERTLSDRTTLLALHAAEEAVAAAGWRGKDFAVVVGCSRGPTESWEQGFAHFTETGAARLRTSPQTTLGSIGFALANYFGTRSLADSLSVTCSSGMHALLHGVALLRAGMVDRVLVGGTEAPLTTFTLRQLQALRIYAEVPSGGQHACRPLSTPASGMVVGEGAGFLALSREPGDFRLSGLAFAREQEASPTGISREGLALQTTMRELAQLQPTPDLIVAHAPGTKRGDAAEQAAIRSVYGAADSRPSVTSFKWATGHTFGASGPLAVSKGLALLVAPEALAGVLGAEGVVNSLLVNTTGFGGNVVSVIVSR